MIEAIAREKQIKAGSRAKKIALIEGLNPEWKDLYELLAVAEVCARNPLKVESLESLRSKNASEKCPCRYSQISKFVIRFGGRFVQLTAQDVCPVTETGIFRNPNWISRLRVSTVKTSA